MRDMRLFGNNLEKLCKEETVSEEVLCAKLNCTKARPYGMYKGFVMPTFDQLDSLAEVFQTTVKALLDGNIEHYNTTVVSCMGELSNPDGREEILDIIESYVELASSVR